MKKDVVLFAIFVLSFALFGESKPKWIENLNMFYHESDYLAAVGVGKSLSEAQIKAASTIASMIKVKIKSDLDLTAIYNELRQNDVVKKVESSKIVDKSKQIANQELIGLKFDKNYTDKEGFVYTIAYIDRDESAGIYKELIQKDSDLIVKMVESAKAETFPLKKYAFLTFASAAADNAARLREQLLVINKSAYQTLKLPYNPADIVSQRQLAAKETAFKLEWRNGAADEKINDLLINVINKNGFSVAQSGGAAIKIDFSFERADLNNKYKNIRWRLALKLLSSEGDVVGSLDEGGRASGASESDAKRRSYAEIEKVVDKKFKRLLSAYFINSLPSR